MESYTAFVGDALVASGPLSHILPILKDRFKRNLSELVLVFEDDTGKQVDFDLSDASLAPPRMGPGRPKLGVVSREITLLPRHWEWLEQQPNGASAAIRRMVERERRNRPDEQRSRMAIEATSRFITAMAGNLPGYEEASRALWAGNRERFDELVEPWPRDIRLHAQRLLDEIGGRLCESNTPAT